MKSAPFWFYQFMMWVYTVTMRHKYGKEIMYMKTAENFPSKINYSSLKYNVHFSARLRTSERAASLVPMQQ